METSQMHHGIYIMGCIWQPCWILQEKVGISFSFWIMRVVNSQLALYCHVICKAHDTHSANSRRFWRHEFAAISRWICSNAISMVPCTHSAFFRREKSHDKKGSRVKKSHDKKSRYVCHGTNPLDTPQMTITNVNYEGSYWPGVICNIVVKGDLGRWTSQWIENRCLEYCYTKLHR